MLIEIRGLKLNLGTHAVLRDVNLTLDEWARPRLAAGSLRHHAGAEPAAGEQHRT